MNATLAIIIAAISFSFCPLLYAVNLGGSSAMTQALYVQISVAFVASIAMIVIRRGFSDIVKATTELFQMPWTTWIVIVLSGVAGYMGTLFFLWAIENMSSAGASIIMESWPIMAVFMAPALISNHQKPITFLHFMIMAIIIVGMLMISASDSNMTIFQFISNPFFMFMNRDFNQYIGIICAILSALCYAWAGISRPYFSSLLPYEYRKKHFVKGAPFFETLYSFWLTCLCAMPIAMAANIFMNEPLFVSGASISVSVIIGLCLTLMGCMYAYALMVSNSSTINLLWYIAPVIATLWLVLFGYSQVTPLLIIGGGLIILANIVLVLTNKKQNNKLEA